MLENSNGTWHCTDCGHSSDNMHSLSHCPKCKTPLVTDQSRSIRGIHAANAQFLARLKDAVRASQDSQLSLTIKIVRGEIVGVKLQSHEDWRLDTERIA